MTLLDPEDFRPLAFPDFYSLGEQSEARTKLQEALDITEVEVDQERRQRELGPEQNVMVGTGHEITDSDED